MSSIFSKIIKGEIPSYKIAEDERFYAFLDIFPITKGHTLVIPKVEVDYIFDLEDELIGDLFRFSKRVGKAIETVIPCERIGMTVLGLEIPHAHIHLVPLDKVGIIDFRKPKAQFTKEEFENIAQQIAGVLE